MVLSVRAKILLLAAIPFFMFASGLGAKLYENYQSYNALDRLETVSILSTYLSSAIHEVQKERGLSAIYLSSDKGASRDKLNEQRALTNDARQALTSFVKDLEIAELDTLFRTELEKVLSELDGLSGLRSKVNNHNISGGEAASAYSSLTGSMIDLISDAARLSSDREISALLASYVTLIRGKETAG